MWQIVRRLVDDGTTVLLTTQHLEEADRLADTVAVLSEGRGIDAGTPAEMEARGVRPRIVRRVGVVEVVKVDVLKAGAGQAAARHRLGLCLDRGGGRILSEEAPTAPTHRRPQPSPVDASRRRAGRRASDRDEQNGQEE